MAKATGIKITALVADARRYVKERLREADSTGDGELNWAEARKLPKDLRDNLERYALATGANHLDLEVFTSVFQDYLSGVAARADRSRDGYISGAEVRRLPVELHHNVLAYHQFHRADPVSGEAITATVHQPED